MEEIPEACLCFSHFLSFQCSSLMRWGEKKKKKPEIHIAPLSLRRGAVSRQREGKEGPARTRNHPRLAPDQFDTIAGLEKEGGGGSAGGGGGLDRFIIIMPRLG